MTAASYKCNDIQNYPGQCVTARTFLPQRKEGAGHWLVAFRKAEEDRFRAVQRRKIKETFNKQKNRSTPTDDAGGKNLDRALLLQLHCVEKPSELCCVDISEQELNSVKAEDLTEFENVAYIDASVNFLSLGSFSSFVSLRELNLSLNGLSNMTFNVDDFPFLEVLDLSYNSLSGDCIVSIGRLLHLRVLHLTGNKLHHLPPDPGSSNHDPDQPSPKADDTWFKTLEVLMLDDNKLSSGVFNSLANLRRLRHLNLQKNRINEIPFLHLVDNSRPFQNAKAPTEPNRNTDDDKVKRVTQSIHVENWESYQESSLPLPELQILNVSCNKFVAEEALLPVALFPKLREIDISLNPLTTKRSGDPPLLTFYLQDQLGVIIKRKDTQGVKSQLKVSTNPKWKVKEMIPKAPKKPLVKNASRPALTHIEDTAEKKKTASVDINDGDEDIQHFFLTESQEKETVEKQEENDNSHSEKFTHFNLLLDVKADPHAAEHIGIQTAVRMLEHTLKNLNIYRDSKPKLDSIQTSYREQEKQIKALPPLKPAKHVNKARVDEMIKEMKASTTIREVPLSRVIHGKGVNKQEYKEAVALMEDMRTKYKMVHEKTREQAANMDSKTPTKLD
ncbi:X-ray radiation resistance-associated protein 1 [Sphaeramia orbicularis]|uniref:X-ray radiation resistance-associated protein 1 n=1 Tax=Sphaeramia orbicularis TaxID=375764 RepID=UPI00117C12A3|nr:X-ray radiation resistance-associated protein 1 [Sphaeramia orbicularis]